MNPRIDKYQCPCGQDISVTDIQAHNSTVVPSNRIPILVSLTLRCRKCGNQFTIPEVKYGRKNHSRSRSRTRPEVDE